MGQVLGVDRDATRPEIYEASRKRVQETHPDKGGDEDKDEHKRVIEARKAMLNE